MVPSGANEWDKMGERAMQLGFIGFVRSADVPSGNDASIHPAPQSA